MKAEDRQVIYTRLEEQNGKDHQLTVGIAELSELIKEITKLLRSDAYTATKNICDEIADVKVILEQLQRFLKIDDAIIDTIMDYKLKRLEMFYLKKIRAPIEFMTLGDMKKDLANKIDSKSRNGHIKEDHIYDDLDDIPEDAEMVDSDGPDKG